MKAFKVRRYVPIYDREIYLAVADTTTEAARLVSPHFTVTEPFSEAALTCWRDTSFGLLFSTGALSHDIVAHEVFHATHCIMESTNDKFDSGHHEPYAYLCGWLTAWVYREFNKRKVRIR
jgi:hypothetical protein